MILALDTSSALTSVALVDSAGLVVIERTHEDALRHAEVIGPMLAEVIAAVRRHDVTAVACGVGPGPYTGLRVGIAAAIAVGAAWSIPVHGLCSLDALAAQALDERPGEPVDVGTDARRSEIYWASYAADGARTDGPRVRPAVDVGPDVVRGMPSASWVGRRVRHLLADGAVAPTEEIALDTHGEDTGATAAALAGAGLLLPRPLYLRRPDAIVPAGVVS